MSLKTLEDYHLDRPEDGRITLAVARHITAGYPDPAIPLLHRRRAELIHALTDELSIPVEDWGATDSEHPHEIVGVILALAPVVIPAAATIIAAWITRPKPNAADNQGLLGVKIRRSDGAELTLSYRSEPEGSKLDERIQAFLAGRA